jgi:diguanylate cyclase (GGDEF)-like protein
MGLRFLVVGTVDAATRRELEAFGGGSEVRGPLEPAEAVRLLLGEAVDAVVAALPPFPQRLDLEIARAARDRQPLSLLSIEVDGLEDLRLAQGLAAVEAYLGQLEAALRRSLRALDLLVRLPDDSFGVVLPATGGEGADLVAERLRALAARLLAKPPEGSERRIPWKATVSVGVAVLPAGGEVCGRDLLDRAVEARRRARTAGGDRATA